VSKVPKAVATASVLSDFYSDFQSKVPKRVATDSQLSNAWSNIASHVSGITATVDATSIASAVWVHATASDLTSKVGKLTSRVTKEVANASQLLLVKSVVSDAHSAAILAASHASDAYSAALLTQSLASDAHSAAVKAYSQVILNGSAISDVQSALDSQYLKVMSAISDVESALDSQFVWTSNVLSDIGSQLDVQDGSYVDATVLTANTIKERIRRINWILQNKMNVNDVTGTVKLFKDDNTTSAYTVAGGVTDNGVSTVRKRLE
jgi:hypothetical protein